MRRGEGLGLRWADVDLDAGRLRIVQTIVQTRSFVSIGQPKTDRGRRSVALDRATILNVDMTVETRTGKTARGFGSMPLSNVWAFPTRRLTYDQTLNAMKKVAEVAATNQTECASGVEKRAVTSSTA